jgi:hypothetical protein
MTPHGETPDTDLQLMRSFRVFDAEGHETDSESLVFADVARKLERQRDALKKQVESAFKLLSAVTDSGCNDVDGKNWYDARTALLSKPSNPTP